MYQDIEIANAASFSASNPQTTNFATEFNFRLWLTNCPIFSQTITGVSFPGIDIGTATFNTPLLDIPEFGDKLAFRDITVTYSLLDDLSNYMEIFAWTMYLTGNEEGISERQQGVVKNLRARDLKYGQGGRNKFLADSVKGIYTDATLSMYSRNKVEIASFNLEYLVPVSVSGFQLNSQAQTDTPLQGTVTFRFLNMRLNISTDTQSKC